MISMRSKYAIKALSFMARSKDKESYIIAELAAAENIPKKFLEAILIRSDFFYHICLVGL